ncbi:GxxExxY protein [bacterium]|nr:GxxExxY protein [bacterium]
MELKHAKITKDIIGSAFEVYNILGYGFLEKVYQRALQVELLERDHLVELEYALEVIYKEEIVGNYFTDLFVDNKVIVELKVSPEYNPKDEAQILNQLKAANIEIGLLINFGRKEVEFKRFIY